METTKTKMNYKTSFRQSLISDVDKMVVLDRGAPGDGGNNGKDKKGKEKENNKKRAHALSSRGWGGCSNAIFLETRDFKLHFSDGLKFLAPMVGSGEFFENRVRSFFGAVQYAPKSKIGRKSKK